MMALDAFPLSSRRPQALPAGSACKFGSTHDASTSEPQLTSLYRPQLLAPRVPTLHLASRFLMEVSAAGAYGRGDNEGVLQAIWRPAAICWLRPWRRPRPGGSIWNRHIRQQNLEKLAPTIELHPAVVIA
jgi:hypothetical protein